MSVNRVFNILHIEDNPDDVKIISKFFKQSGIKFDIVNVDSGNVGLEKIMKKKFDIILLDYHLPDMNGLDVLKEIKKRNTYIPVIMITGTGDVKIIVESMKFGASDYIVKSVNEYKKLPLLTQNLIQEYDNNLMSQYTEEEKRRRIYKNKFAFRFLKKMIELKTPLSPVSSLDYWYQPNIFQSLNISITQFEKLLELLSSLQILLKENTGVRIHCPNCSSHNVKITYRCPYCGSISFRKEECIEHMKDSYADTINEFLRGNSLICPKCNDKLHIIGVDYRKLGMMYKCEGECGNIFSDLKQIYICHDCNLKFDLIDAIIEKEYEYSLNYELLDEIKNNLFTFDTLKSVLEEEGYKVEINKNIYSPKNLKNYSVDLFCLKKGSYAVTIIIDVDEKGVSPSKLIDLYTLSLEHHKTLYFLVAIPFAKENTKELAKQFNVTVIEVDNFNDVTDKIIRRLIKK